MPAKPRPPKKPANPRKAKPLWVVLFGVCQFRYYTEYHAEQFAYALRLNGTPHIAKYIPAPAPAKKGR